MVKLITLRSWSSAMMRKMDVAKGKEVKRRVIKMVREEETVVTAIVIGTAKGTVIETETIVHMTKEGNVIVAEMNTVCRFPERLGLDLTLCTVVALLPPWAWKAASGNRECHSTIVVRIHLMECLHLIWVSARRCPDPH